MSSCQRCRQPAPESHNYCSWECMVEEAKELGGQIICPNGLPIRCIRHDHAMLEHEHADHPNYKFPVAAEYAGDVEDVTHRDEDGTVLYVSSPQTHALIYNDGDVALTLYEHCHAMWSVRSGELLYGSLWDARAWKFTSESMELLLKARKNDA